MILLERDPALPVAVETVKAQVLLTLRTMHAVREYDTVADLAAFLDDVLDQLVAIDAPRGLSRVVLFHRSPAAVTEVAKRLLPGAAFQAFQAPGCWMTLGRRLPELRAWAKRIEPSWPTNLPKGI